MVLQQENLFLILDRFGLWGAGYHQTEHRGAPCGRVQKQQLLHRHTSRVETHCPEQGLYVTSEVPHYHLQHLLLPPASVGFSENLSEPHAEPSNLCGSGKVDKCFFLYYMVKFIVLPRFFPKNKALNNLSLWRGHFSALISHPKAAKCC